MPLCFTQMATSRNSRAWPHHTAMSPTGTSFYKYILGFVLKTGHNSLPKDNKVLQQTKSLNSKAKDVSQSVDFGILKVQVITKYK
ncbi:rCG42949 [Rattus norvegicus]|uniref:RCG42949 n=1 Tax=Rattus norvegicus TaxID=10116 RepID=A6IWT5_RAT|nr:rCG42949 [Rattus norvegicus]